MNLDLELTSSFMVLMDEEHFGRAARRLHVTTPGLTKRIQRLELQLGVTLLERGPGGVLKLTRAGLRFAEVAGPLLVQAQAAVQLARDEIAPVPLRIGVPAGTAEFLQIIRMGDLVRTIRREHGETRIVAVNVPYSALRTCLTDDRVDLLLTVGPVRDPRIQSSPLPITANRVGVVHAHHPLAEAGVIRVAEFCEEAILYDPSVPNEFMNQFWLGDIRLPADARLVQTRANDLAEAMKGIDRSAVMVSLDRIRMRLPAQLKPVGLTDAVPVQFFAARRRDDHRLLLQALVEKLMRLPALRF